MRVLLLLRGSAGCGKSTWIEKNGLKQYTLCADDIRMLCQGPQLQVNGEVAISQNNDSIVWKTLFRLLEVRMQHGEFTVIDATNSKTSEMNRYKELCQNYRYRLYCVDFTDIPIEETKRRNAQREPLKRVPDEVIDKMYSRFATQKIPSGITVLKPDELEKIWYKKSDFNNYEAIHHIGDIHGCWSSLKEYIDKVGGIKDEHLWIFTGDYLDRGIENAEVLKFLLEIYKKPNVILLEGNHEQWIKLYAHDVQGKSKEFELVTKPQLDAANFNKKELRQLWRKFSQCSYYTYDGKDIFVCHAGVSNLPENLIFLGTEQMIRGVGSYNDMEKSAESFQRLTNDNTYQIHGHRNTKSMPIQINERVMNLEGHVEFGGHLRAVTLDQNGFHYYEIKNDVFKEPEEIKKQEQILESAGDLLLQLRGNKYINEKQFGNISSFNFNQKAFYDKVWDSQTIKARGLYIDTLKGKVAARAYEKFFNINERPETKFDMLEYKLKFPVEVFVKENGFLGIVSYDEYNDNLFITTKSNPDSDFAQWLKEMLYEKYPHAIDKIKKFCKENEVSFVFECVDMKHDPHIIDYPESKLILLDIIKNDITYSKYKFEDMCRIANDFKIEHKKKAYEIANWQDFFDWYYDVLQEDYEYDGAPIEGFVIEAADGYMIKVKLSYYNFWKFMRSIAHEVIRKGHTGRTSALTTSIANEFYAYMKQFFYYANKDSLPKDIVTLRRWFYEDKMRKKVYEND